MATASDRGGGGGARPRHPADVERGKMSFSSGKKSIKCLESKEIALNYFVAIQVLEV